VNEFAVDLNSVYVNKKIGCSSFLLFALFHMIIKDKARLREPVLGLSSSFCQLVRRMVRKIPHLQTGNNNEPTTENV
jgi:hypothetical protein